MLQRPAPRVLTSGVTVAAMSALVVACGTHRSLLSTRRAPTSSRPAAVSTQLPAAEARPLGGLAPGSARPLAGLTVVVDPGHDGGNAASPAVIAQLVPAGRGRDKPCNTTGTATATGYAEAAFNWDVAQRLKQLLVSAGAGVTLTRNSNTGVGPCVNQRAAIGNRAAAAAVIAIHADGAPPAGRGFDIIYPPDFGPTATIYAGSLNLAHAVHAALRVSGVLPSATYVGHDGYDERDDLASLNLSTRPAILVELGNMRNPADAAIQVDPGRRELLARALANGLERYLRGARRPQTPQHPTESQTS